MLEISAALELDQPCRVEGSGHLASRFRVTDLATSTVGAVGSAVARLLEGLGLAASRPPVTVNRRLASLWFARSIHPVGWEMPPVWDAIAGDYETQDGWIKLHTNLPHHRRAACAVLGVAPKREAVKAAVRTWRKDELEAEIAGANGVSAAMRAREEWIAHLQGTAVASEPLIDWTPTATTRSAEWPASLERPLAGLRVLDLTRVLAGPVATRTLAGFGAEVLRIDPVDWDEPNVVPDVTLGKRCARLDLRTEEGRETLEELLSNAHVLVHGYRPDALGRLGLGDTWRESVAPDLLEVRLDAYGWTGPWAGRRGFDSLVQMSCGIANAGMRWAKRDVPTPLPVQALDHATGYLMAAAVIRSLDAGARGEPSRHARLSLARTAELLLAHEQDAPGDLSLEARIGDFAAARENTPWGPARRLLPPVDIQGTRMYWQSPACELGSSPASWN